jgi:hypothetical protein
VKELIKQHFGAIVLAFAILLAVIIHACATRYVIITSRDGRTGGDDVVVYDRWTGQPK